MSWRYSGEYTIRAFRSLLTLSISQLLSLDTNELMSCYRTWGPCARTCITLVQGQLKVDRHQKIVSTVAAKFASDPRQLFGLVTQLDSDEVSHVLFFVRPKGFSADSRSEIKVEVPTNHLRSIIALAVARIDPTVAFFQPDFLAPLDQDPRGLDV